MTSIVSIEKVGHVWTVLINRPEHQNRINAAISSELFKAFIEFELDDDARVAVLYGTGGTFSHGLEEPISYAEEFTTHTFSKSRSSLGPSRLSLTKPVIAAISGYCGGEGMELALWADLRVVEENALFCMFNRRNGIAMKDGGTVRLTRLIGHSKALDIILTGRIVPAPEAFHCGLANRIVPIGSSRLQAETIAHMIASFPQQALRADRTSTYFQFGKSLEDAMKFETSSADASLSPFQYRCVFFDLGGVVFDSPLAAIQKHAKSKHADLRKLNMLFKKSISFSALEKGKISLEEFIPLFQLECEHQKLNVNISEMFDEMRMALKPRRRVITCIEELRRNNIKVVALTNNWRRTKTCKDGDLITLKPFFDDIIESCVIGYRKPEKEIFDIACMKMNVKPTECIFLDDIGQNLKTARIMKWTTIHVTHNYMTALKTLQEYLPHIDLKLSDIPSSL